MRAIRKISAIFIPLIPALIACGLIAGINGILTNLGWLPGVTPFLGVLSSGFLSLLAVFVGMNAAKEFGGTPILGGAVGAIVVAAGVANVTVFGQTLAPGQGGVLGAMAGGILAALVERFMRRHTPDVIALIVVPTVTVLVAGSITLGILMSVAGVVSVAIGAAATWLLANGGAFAGFILGGFFLPLVMTGMHQALTPIHTTLIDQTGWTVLLPVLAMGGAGQIGAALALWMRFRRNEALVADHPWRTARRAPRRRRAPHLRRDAPPGSPVHHGLHRWGVRWRCRRAVRPARALRRGDRHRGLGPVAPAAAQRVVGLRLGAARVRVGARRGVRRRVRGDAAVRGVRVGQGRPRGAVRSRCAARPGVVGRAC